MFDREKNKVIIFMYENVMHYPPVLNAIECMLNNLIKVNLVAEGTDELPEIITGSSLFAAFPIDLEYDSNIVKRISNRINRKNFCIKKLNDLYQSGDIVWTVNPLIVRTMGKSLLCHSDHHVMQLMEMFDEMELFDGAKILKFNIHKYGQSASKVVVPEQNRAYIMKTVWGLKNTPYVLPNKPYYFDPGEMTDEVKSAIQEMQNEKRKIVLYLGVIDPDRDFESFANAIDEVGDEFCLYLIGKCVSEDKMKDFCKEHNSVKYLGFFNPPSHLHFLRYAHIGLLPYKPGAVGKGDTLQEINALYCAPNKIYEYAGSNLPMLGTDVLGLKVPFEKYNIGMCCKSLDKDSIISALRYIDIHHDEMMKGCKNFYEEIDLDELIMQIIKD